MLYQKILMDDAPYDLELWSLAGYVEHRHADIEFNYCIRGSREVIIDKKKYVINEGEISVIPPGVSHEFPPSEQADRLMLTGVMGSSFLKKYFSAFSSANFHQTIINLNTGDECRTQLKRSLDNVAKLYDSPSVQSSLLIMGELYKVCAYLLDLVAPADEERAVNDAELEALERIDAALELIYYDYKRTVTVDEAALVSGYGKSNFCKIFKKTTGMTFHEALNRRRIEVACGLLCETGLSVSEIAEEVGFDESKNFCRVFKASTGETPRAYRQKSRSGGGLA